MNILFPTDFSENSEAALNYAVDFMQGMDAEITMLHVYKTPVMESVGGGGFSNFSTGPGARLQEKVKKDVEDSTLKKMVALRDKYGLTEDNCRCLIVEGNVKSEIDKLIEGKIFDVVVLGTKGEGSKKGVFFGGIATHLIHKANCPVIAIPSGTMYQSVNHIVYPTDLVHDELNSLKWLMNYAKIHNAKLHLIHISEEYGDDKSDEFDHLIEQIPYDKIDYETVRGDDIPHVLVEISKDPKVDMISMTTHTNTLFDRLFHSSLTEDVLDRIQIPFIGFSDKNQQEYHFS